MNSKIDSIAAPEIWIRLDEMPTAGPGGFKVTSWLHAPRGLSALAESGLKVDAAWCSLPWQPEAPIEQFPWAAARERFAKLREIEIRPLVCLFDGRSASLTPAALDDFSDRLVRFAAAFAQRFPWIDRYAPIDEPWTTACLVTNPSRRNAAILSDEGVFQAHQQLIRATLLAMQAIRQQTPSARLLQSEGLRKAHGSGKTAKAVRLGNQQRWLTFDALCGSVTKDHPLWRTLLRAGVARGGLDWIRDHRDPPDQLGLSYGIASERYVSHRVERFPASSHVEKEAKTYADIDAVRGSPRGPDGLERLLRECWHRYKLPMVLTDVSFRGGRESQLRWLHEAWTAATRLCRMHIPLRAVTLGSPLGTVEEASEAPKAEARSCYANGLFDLRSPTPRPTALLRAAVALRQGEALSHPVHLDQGWWANKNRLAWPSQPHRPAETRGRPILITGAEGSLGLALRTACAERNLAVRVFSRSEWDIAHLERSAELIQRLDPWAIANAAGYTRLRQAEQDRAACWRSNVEGPRVLATLCREHDIPLLTFSSELVFDGRQAQPYLENDPLSPEGGYATGKANADRLVLEMGSKNLIVRSSAFFDAGERRGWLRESLEALMQGQPVQAANDVWMSPTYLPDLANAALDLLIDGECGVWHLANQGRITPYEAARHAAELLGVSTARLTGLPGDPVRKLPSSRSLALGSSRGTLLEPLEGVLERFLKASGLQERQTPAATAAQPQESA